ncbi:MAG: DUF3386 family protein [Candidatus Binatia bacterium]|nr:DUF3386 family protein [Nitrospirota bacterium]
METSTRQETQTDVHDDPKARALMQKAFEKTARWPTGFGGFQADLCINIDGQETKGTVTVKGPKEVTVTLSNPELENWTQNQLAMIAVHRGPRSFQESDGKYSLTLDADDNHPLGPRLSIHGDGMGSSYRIKDERITQINRKMAHVAFTINVEESALTEDQKNLTTRYTVYYFSPKDGSLQNVESLTDTHVRVASADLPATRRIISYENGQVVTKTLLFENHKAL